jgi:hypothetical protein
MSFEVFIQCFTCGERDGVAVADIQHAFGPQLQVGEQDWWKVVYDEQNYCDILMRFLPPDRRLVHFMSVQRPCGDRRLWEALFATLRLGHVVLYFPAKKPPLLVSDESVSEHLPKDMVESMGAVTRVGSAQDILNAIQKA